LLALLEGIREQGEEAFLGDVHVQLEAERALQVAIQICIDVGAHLISALGLTPPDDFRGVFTSLRQAGVLDADLAERLGDAAGLRNLLVHGYADIDHRRLWHSLGALDDLRQFAAAAASAAERERSPAVIVPARTWPRAR
jgi:uncharacterized protein YutE (UPF0331/DUF86 family)